MSLHTAELRRSRVYAVAPGIAYGAASPFGAPGPHPSTWQGQNWTSWLSPSAVSGEIYGIGGGQQVGVMQGATLWNGSPESFVSLHPPGYFSSVARATDGTTQVGEVVPPGLGLNRAVLWHGTAESAVFLQPQDARESAATSVVGTLQGGWVSYSTVPIRAALWSGSAESIVSMHPGPGYHESMISGMVAGQQVGWARPVGLNDHAGIWFGTPESFIDLNPPGANSRLLATCGSAQVGWANVTGLGVVAGVWFGTAESFVPLGSLLPPGQFFQSTATSVAEHNGVLYVGGYADGFDSNTYAFLWTGPVPAPGSGALLLGAGILAARRRSPHRSAIQRHAAIR